MNRIEIAQIIAAGESETLELKRSTGQLSPAGKTRATTYRLRRGGP